MKKNIIMMLILACMFVVGSSTLVFAEDVLSTAGEIGELNIGNDANSLTLDIGLSPKVVARWVSPGTTIVLAQWYALAVGHPGGNRIYCSGQNLNNMGYMGYSTGTTLDNAVLNIPTTKASEDDFRTLGWSFD